MLRFHLFYKITFILQYLFRHKKFWKKLYGIVKKGVWGKEKLKFSVSNFINILRIVSHLNCFYKLLMGKAFAIVCVTGKHAHP